MPHQLNESWSEILAWLRGNAPVGLVQVSPPATPDKIASVASRISATLPDDLVYDERYGTMWPVAESDRHEDDSGTPKRSLWNLKSETIPAASEAFRNKDYARCIELLAPFEDVLDKVAAAKLALARKKRRAEQ